MLAAAYLGVVARAERCLVICRSGALYGGCLTCGMCRKQTAALLCASPNLRERRVTTDVLDNRLNVSALFNVIIIMYDAIGSMIPF